jgi:hypothetical protein
MRTTPLPYSPATPLPKSAPGFAGDPKRGSMLRRSMAQADEDETIK